MLGDEIQRARCAKLGQDGICIRYARDFDIDPVSAFLIDIRFSRILLDTALQLIDRIIHIIRRRIGRVRFISDGHTAGQIQTGLDIPHRARAAGAETV